MDLKSTGVSLGALTLLGILFLIPLFFDAPYEYVKNHLSDNTPWVALIYIVAVILAEVVAPIAALPLAPVVAGIVGPLPAALYSVIGWTIGAMIAFLIARHLAQPVIARFVNLEEMQKYESYIPERHVFFWMVFLRMVLPVDVLSYALGFFSTVRFVPYTIATVIGVIPFSLIWSYGGHALIEKNYTMLAIAAVAGLALFGCALYIYSRHKRHKKS